MPPFQSMHVALKRLGYIQIPEIIGPILQTVRSAVDELIGLFQENFNHLRIQHFKRLTLIGFPSTNASSGASSDSSPANATASGLGSS